MKRKSLLFSLLFALIAPWAANAQTLFSEGFEGGSMPTGWTTDGPGTWSVGSGDYSSSTGAGMGTYNALITHGTTGDLTKLITPEIDLSSVPSATLSFMHVQRSWAGDFDYLKVYYRTSSSETWTQLVAYTGAVASWTTEEDIALPNISATYQLAFEYTDNWGYGVGLDEVKITLPAACPKPTLGQAEYISEEGASFQWTENGSATQWQLQYSTSADFSNPTTITRNGIPALAVTGLSSGTTYYFRLRSLCGADEYSDWSNVVSFNTLLCAEANMCAINITLTDAYGDGGGQIQVVDALTNLVLGTYTNASSSSSYTLNVCDGREINFVFTSTDNWPYENGWVITDINEDVISEHVGCTDGCADPTNGVIATYTVSCTASSCRKPTGLTIAEVTANTATLRWTENGEATAWMVEVTDLDGGQMTTWNASATEYQIVGLNADTPYSVRVNPVCDVEKWSDPITFRTTELCPKPTDVTASDVTPMSANVSWTGTASSYNLRYKEIDASQYAIVTLNPDDVWGDGTGYQMLLDADATAYGSIIPETGALASGDVSDAVFAEFEYKIPVNADGLTTTTNVLIAKSVSILIPAGTYDWCITNPTPGDAFWIASGNGSIGGRYDDYVFEAGKAYEFHVYMSGSNDATDLTIVDFNGTDEGWSDPVVATSPYALANLNSETGYEVQVQASCGEDGESAWVSAYFITPSNCAAPSALESTDVMPHSATLNWTGYQDSYTVRYRTAAHSEAAPGALFEDFESASLTTNGWTVRREGEGTEYTDWRVFTPASFEGDVTAHSGDYVVMGRSWSNEAYSVDNWLISPQVTLDGELSYWVLDDGQYHEHYDVYVSTTTTETSAFTLVYEPGDASSEWTQHTVDLSSYAGQQGYIAFRLVDEDQDFLFLDDITLGSVVEVPAGEWKEVEVSALPYTLENLEDETEYEWQVQGINAGCDGGVTEWSEIATFTTLNACADITNLMLDDLTATSMTLSWTGVQDSYLVQYRTAEGVNPKYFYDPANEQGDWTTDNLEENSGWDILPGYFTFYYTSNPPQTLISPELTDIPSNSILAFDYVAYDASYPETFKVGFSTTDNSVESFTWGDEVTATNVQFLTYTVSVPDGAKYFAIQCTSDDQYALILDDFTIGAQYAEAGEWNYITVTEPTVTIDGLNGLTTYDVYVQGVCGEDEYTQAVGGQVTTLEQTTLTQTVNLAAGTNWFSTYVDITLAQLEEAIVAGMTDATNTTIKAKDGKTTTYNGTRWRGTLTSLDVAQMYKIVATSACEITLEGMPIDPASHPINVKANATTWIGFPFSQSMTVTNALAGFNAVSGDQIKAKSGSSTSFNGTRWRGGLTNLEPGQGYVFSSKASEDRTLVYSNGSAKATQADVKPLGFFSNKQIDKTAISGKKQTAKTEMPDKKQTAKTATPLELKKDGKAKSAKRIRK